MGLFRAFGVCNTVSDCAPPGKQQQALSVTEQYFEERTIDMRRVHLVCVLEDALRLSNFRVVDALVPGPNCWGEEPLRNVVQLVLQHICSDLPIILDLLDNIFPCDIDECWDVENILYHSWVYAFDERNETLMRALDKFAQTWKPDGEFQMHLQGLIDYYEEQRGWALNAEDVDEVRHLDGLRDWFKDLSPALELPGNVYIMLLDPYA
jgi:hypothetical protein